MIPLANHLWQSTLFAAAAGLITLFLRTNRAQVRYWLWLSASVKFLIPFSILVAAGGLIGRNAVHVPVIAPSRSVIVLAGAPFTAAPVSQITVATVERSYTSVIAVILGAVWAIGFVVLVCRWIRRYRRMHALVRKASPLDLPISFPVKISPAFGEPGVFGILRPALLLPDGIMESLSAPEMQAIVMHELCHVRRGDTLATAIHMAVEAVFWFHPLVWWLGARLLEERERACDEEVLRTGVEPRVYAESILKICEMSLASPLECVAGVTGGDLKRRIEAIMSGRVAVRLNPAKKAALALAGLIVLAAPVTIGTMRAPVMLAQAPPLAVPPAGPARTYIGPEFDVASIKPVGRGPHHPPNSLDLPLLRGFQRSRPGLFHMFNVTLNLLIQLAYDDSMLVGGPAWMNSERYEVIAKTGGNVTPEQMRPMLKTLLGDRFKLTLRREPREIPVYRLTVAKDGLKINAASEGSCVTYGPDTPRPPFDPKRPAPLNGCGDFRRQILSGPPERRDRIEAVGVPMSKLIEFISQDVRSVVLDHTRFTGTFDFQLEYAPSEAITWSTAPLTPGEIGAGVPLPTALQQQLGLRLESIKAVWQVLAVDHVEKPSEN